jgi:hypothetical protein
LPAKFDPKIEAGDNVIDPLQRFFAREASQSMQLLGALKADLGDLIGVCKGDASRRTTRAH